MAAIAMYTFDLSLITIDALPEENFYHRLNHALRLRDPAFLQEGKAYLHYLMKGLESLPSYTWAEGGWLWRGVSAEGRDRVVEQYTEMRQVCCSISMRAVCCNGFLAGLHIPLSCYGMHSTIYMANVSGEGHDTKQCPLALDEDPAKTVPKLHLRGVLLLRYGR
jgi:hypothetical protein